MQTQLYALHPIMLAKQIREAIGDQRHKDVAKQLGITVQYLDYILAGQRALSKQVAAKLHLLGLNGLELYLSQEIHSYLRAAYHTDGGDPIGKKHFEKEEAA